MDNGPFRMSSRADKDSSSSRPAGDPPEKEPVRREPEPATHEAPAPRRTSRASSLSSPTGLSGSKESPFKKLPLMPLIAGALVLIVIAVAFFFFMNKMGKDSSGEGIDGGKYQAILLTNGEAYLGKLSVLNDKYLKLVDIFYLKPQSEKTADGEALQTQTTDQSVQLIKFGGEVQGPEDEMIIARDQVLYYQNLKTDGKASKAIEEYKKSN